MTKEKEIATKKEYARRAGLYFTGLTWYKNEQAFEVAKDIGYGVPMNEWEVLGNPEYLKKVWSGNLGSIYGWKEWHTHVTAMAFLSIHGRWEYVSENLEIKQ